MKPLRIAHVTATFPPLRTGTGNVCYHNARQLAERGHAVTVFTARRGAASNQELLDGIQVIRLKPLVKYGNASLLPALFSQMHDFDLLHLHMPFYGAAAVVYLFHKLTSTPLVITHHQDVVLHGPARIVSRMLDWLIGRRLMTSADKACFTSLDYARHSKFADLIEHNRLRLAKLPNGVDTSHFSPRPKREYLQVSIGLESQYVALFVGALDRAHYFKGLDVLLRAINRPELANLALVIVGQGDMQPVYEREVDTLGLRSRVHFAGFVPDKQLPDYYRFADVTVLPSTTAGEAFGLVLLESLACATPVVAADLPGVRTVVAAEQDGLLATPASAEDLAAKLVSLLSRPAPTRLAMGLAGRRKVETRYAWSKLGDLLEGLYADVLAQEQPVSQETRAEAGW